MLTRKSKNVGDINKIVIHECAHYWLYRSINLMCAENNVLKNMLEKV
jgi:predicted SprT family Zn-dependent metalloprotease